MASSPNTKSTSTSKTVRGEHRFNIARYSLKPVGVVTSATFAVGGYDWSICYYPDDGKEDEAYVSVFVRLMTKNASARALFDLRLVDRATGLPHSVRRSGAPVVFDANKANKHERGARSFMPRSELAASPYLRDDCLTVECVLDVVQEPSLTQTTVSSEIVEPPPSDLWKHLGQLLQMQEGTDVTFKVQGEAFRAHRVVLATRSPVFKAELSGSSLPTSEDDTREIITINDMRPLVFKALLHFIYTDVLPGLDDLGGQEYQELVRNLLEAADRYAMERLKQICRLILRKVLDAKTVAAALASAGQHHCCGAPGDVCVQFMPSAGLEG
ncbi:BTB/POZ and MATH domain-containing protein 1-like [Phragmites australis]|uniref:BTB/POZ and MATH domain-containing protein 1-like n=1 Tax=Phragmites australis TaxID=29695 RepID=UPI002D77AA3C|nr:BTB/POZ and MATH domain-containing protein 1-like [Phragmites australis]